MSDVKIKNVRTTADSEAAPAAKPSPGKMEVTDARGRVIVVKKLNPLDKMRLSRVGGADGAVNQAYMSYVLIAASVVSIAGELEPFPQSITAVEAIVAQLDEDGMDAVTAAFLELNDNNPAEDLAVAKN